MKTAVLCIACKENLYINEFVNYHHDIGFDTIFIYDNNQNNGEICGDVLINEINSGYVRIFKINGYIKRAMFYAYNHFFANFGDEYDWVAVLDCDEFITLNKFNNIKEYLSQDKFNNFKCITINEIIYSDNNHIYYENKAVLERFTEPCSSDLKFYNGTIANRQIKSIVRGNKNLIWWYPHFPGNIDNSLCCNSIGIQQPIFDNGALNWNYECNTEEIFIKHFSTKSLEEWFNKVFRNYPDISIEQSNYHNFNECNYFMFNEKTPEKLKYYNSRIKLDNILNIYICAHKDFNIINNSKIYKIVSSKNTLHDKYSINIIEENENSKLINMQKSYGEFSRINFIYENEILNDYVGFCHYSRQIDINKLPIGVLNSYEVIASTPIIISNISILEQYNRCHNIDDLNMILYIIKQLYPDNYNNYYNIFNTDTALFIGNIFIMQKNDFVNYCKFINSIMNEFNKINNFSSQEDINKYILKNKDKYKDFNFDYQQRLHGFLIERLTHAYIKINFKNIYEYDFSK